MFLVLLSKPKNGNRKWCSDITPKANKRTLRPIIIHTTIFQIIERNVFGRIVLELQKIFILQNRNTGICNLSLSLSIILPLRNQIFIKNDQNLQIKSRHLNQSFPSSFSASEKNCQIE